MVALFIILRRQITNSHTIMAWLIYYNYHIVIECMSYDRFVDDRLLTSRDALNKLQIKVKLIEIDENARDYSQRFGRRVLVKKLLLTIKHNETQEIEEREIDLEELEARMRKERLFSSSNRWVSPTEIKNGFIVASKHLELLADAIALDIIVV
jgi:NH3-dependent NAD+ synthetase